MAWVRCSGGSAKKKNNLISDYPWTLANATKTDTYVSLNNGVNASATVGAVDLNDVRAVDFNITLTTGNNFSCYVVLEYSTNGQNYNSLRTWESPTSTGSRVESFLWDVSTISTPVYIRLRTNGGDNYDSATINRAELIR